MHLSTEGDARAMDFDALLDRVLLAVDRKAFVTPTDGIDDPDEIRVLEPIFEALGEGGFDVDVLRAEVEVLRARNLISERRAVILLQTIAAHPEVEDLDELSRLIAREERIVLTDGGPRLQARMAVVDHHRAVHAFLMGHLEVALDLETRSAAARPWGDSLANILIILLRLDQEDRARSMLRHLRARFPRPLVAQVERYINQDPDLALLRDAVPGPQAPEPTGADPAEHHVPEDEPCDPVLH